MEQVRISKLLAERGICSRREADSYIERGWVLLDGKPVTELGTKAWPDQEITLARAAQSRQTARVTIILNKPVGYVSGQAEQGYRPAVSLVTAQSQYRGDDSRVQFSPTHLRGLAPAGRLDIDSQGLLVLTQDGRIARALIGEESEIDKEYLVRVQGKLGAGGLALLNHGLMLDGQPLKPATVTWQNEDQLRFVLREGKKRQIRRMCEMVGLKVIGLKRVRIGGVMLGDLPPGQWRYLHHAESLLGNKAAPARPKAPRDSAPAPRRAAPRDALEGGGRRAPAGEAPARRGQAPAARDTRSAAPGKSASRSRPVTSRVIDKAPRRSQDGTGRPTTRRRKPAG